MESSYRKSIRLYLKIRSLRIAVELNDPHSLSSSASLNESHPPVPSRQSAGPFSSSSHERLTSSDCLSFTEEVPRILIVRRNGCYPKVAPHISPCIPNSEVSSCSMGCAGFVLSLSTCLPTMAWTQVGHLSILSIHVTDLDWYKRRQDIGVLRSSA